MFRFIHRLIAQRDLARTAYRECNYFDFAICVHRGGNAYSTDVASTRRDLLNPPMRVTRDYPMKIKVSDSQSLNVARAFKINSAISDCDWRRDRRSIKFSIKWDNLNRPDSEFNGDIRCLVIHGNAKGTSSENLSRVHFDEIEDGGNIVEDRTILSISLNIEETTRYNLARVKTIVHVGW